MLALLVFALTAIAPAMAEEVSLRLRIAWGGGAERRWEGRVAIEGAKLAEPVALGVEADEPGSIWLEEGAIVVQARSPRNYDGLDVTITAPAESKLVVALGSADSTTVPAPIEVTLEQLLKEEFNATLDEQGNRLLVRRAPGDLLRVRPAKDALVYAPGEMAVFEIEPHASLLAQEPQLRISAQFYEIRSDRRVGPAVELDPVSGTLPLEIAVPNLEGAYDLVLTALGKRLPLRLNTLGPLNRGLADRRVQLIVLGTESPERGLGREIELRRLVEIDPATNPRWWDRLASLPLLPGMRKGPLGNGDAHTWEHPLGQLIQLGPRGREPEMSWEAYTLPIEHTGKWHMLEVEFPSDVPQSMGISILEPNAAGAIAPVGLDSGIYLPDSAAGSSPEWRRHRLWFWPKTRTPLVLITNRRDGAQAVYRKLRVLEGPTRLPRAFALGTPKPERLLAGYFDQPLFPENFGASEALDAWSGRSLDDWATFHQGAVRLAEYLQHVGYGGVMLNVLADGSTIYPSRLLEPTPRYDTGLFFDSGQDPIRKDVLELLLRVFDREQLKLIPALDFSAPLPELEQLRRQSGTAGIGLEWVGADGRTWSEANPQHRGAGPYYNTLDPRVQQAMIRVARELATRYARQPAFDGLALRLSASGYAQLPGIEWGFDDHTIERFVRETGTQVPGAGENRFADRARFLTGPGRQTWLAWRAKTLHQFYAALQADVARVRPGTRLYLAGAQMLDHPSLRLALRPSLPRPVAVEDALRLVGIYPELYHDSRELVLLRPQSLGPPQPGSLDRVIDSELNDSPDIDKHFRGAAHPGVLAFHRPAPARLPSFDARSPYRNSYTWLLAQMSPAAERNRRQLVHALASLDVQTLVDGGAMLPLGQEDALYDALVVYRSLPAAPFATVALDTQPVVVRTLERDGRTHMYLVNDSPWPAHVELQVAATAEAKFVELGSTNRAAQLTRDASGWKWTLDLAPYDLVGGHWTTADVRVAEASVKLQQNIETELAERVHDVHLRVMGLQNQPALEVLSNPGFENPPTVDETLPGWQIAMGPAEAATLDGANPRTGGQTLKLTGTGALTTVVSRAFDPPKTGRLSMFVWLRVADASRQPNLRLALEGILDGKPYYRHAIVGLERPDGQIGTGWTQYQFQVNDLPLEGLRDLKVRFDMKGPGEVWIDDVDLRHLSFTKQELVELSKLVHLADAKLRSRQFVDCVRVLDSYWPQFLVAHVALTEGRVARAPDPVRAPPPVMPAPKEDSLWGKVKRLGGSILPY
ncbi:MAG: family 10 glycosylhydrolase [Pirellulales bacterium]|nr:family 10 glycosylhydrolase [Pirellulales bacterium]